MGSCGVSMFSVFAYGILVPFQTCQQKEQSSSSLKHSPWTAAVVLETGYRVFCLSLSRPSWRSHLYWNQWLLSLEKSDVGLFFFFFPYFPVGRWLSSFSSQMSVCRAGLYRWKGSCLCCPHALVRASTAKREFWSDVNSSQEEKTAIFCFYFSMLWWMKLLAGGLPWGASVEDLGERSAAAVGSNEACYQPVVLCLCYGMLSPAYRRELVWSPSSWVLHLSGRKHSCGYCWEAVRLGRHGSELGDRRPGFSPQLSLL